MTGPGIQGRSLLFLLFLCQGVDDFLHLFDQPAGVVAVADTVVDLDGQGKGVPPLPLLKPAQGEDGPQVVIALLEIQVEALEIC